MDWLCVCLFSFCQEWKAKDVQRSSDQGKSENFCCFKLFRQKKALAQRVISNRNQSVPHTLLPLSPLQYVRGSDPVLKLMDDEGNIAEELSILKWNTDSVEEFLSEKLDRI